MSDDDSPPSERLTYTEVFTELCPMYIAYGMTYEQYWEGDPWMVRAYAQSYLLKRKIENENAWILGAYIANAFGTVIANAFGKKKANYLDKPLDIFPKTEAEKQMEIREGRKKLINWLNAFKKASTKKNDTGSGQNGEP